MIGVAGTSSYIKYISDEAQAKITDFSVTDSKDTDNIIELESTDGVVNGLNFNIGEFNI